ncbi:hypothetical protein RND71_039750 [Anisodus tanguticus]|uniref:Uncharacterized protein n=1 Tax=Anisodus tanguticus TaxID=243964 RepID=A0AAE1QWE1_9SOLA|nr:hypothetical protein RND71_039750 [Anisodus tanguticus]
MPAAISVQIHGNQFMPTGGFETLADLMLVLSDVIFGKRAERRHLNSVMVCPERTHVGPVSDSRNIQRLEYQELEQGPRICSKKSSSNVFYGKDLAYKAAEFRPTRKLNMQEGVRAININSYHEVADN